MTSRVNTPFTREPVVIEPRAMTPARGWHALRFTPSPRKVRVECAQCAVPMWLPASKVSEYQRCGPACNEAWRRTQTQSRERQCETCGADFTPRPAQIRQGAGRYCSQACNTASHEAVTSAESLARAKEGRRKAIAEGRITFRSGADHHHWKGGYEEGVRRRSESGQKAAYIRRYRARHPDKIREFALRRAKRTAGRLPPGTVKRIGDAQRWKCAICRKGIKLTYQVDHVVPLARGGAHAPANLQLLCRPCNTRKGAKDPADYMRQIGRLL